MADFKILETEIPERMSINYAAGMINQPRGGYLNFKDFQEDTFEDEDFIDGSKENISPYLVSIIVDYLTSYLLTKQKEESFDIALKGVKAIQQYASAEDSNSTDYREIYDKLMNRLDLELSDLCISSAAKLACFGVAYKRGPEYFTGIRDINPDTITIDHIRKLVHRNLTILKSYSEVIELDVDFPKAYTGNIIDGSADYLSDDTLWDLRVLKNRFNKNHSMQLLIAWRLGMKQNHRKYSKVKYIGIISPRHNKAYRYDLSQIPQEFIDFLDYKVIGYKQS